MLQLFLSSYIRRHVGIAVAVSLVMSSFFLFLLIFTLAHPKGVSWYSLSALSVLLLYLQVVLLVCSFFEQVISFTFLSLRTLFWQPFLSCFFYFVLDGFVRILSCYPSFFQDISSVIHYFLPILNC